MMTFSAGVFVFFARVHEALVTNKEVASRKCLAAEITNEWLLLGVSANVALQMFLCASVRIGVALALPRADEESCEYG
jgi:hypothetical protein